MSGLDHVTFRLANVIGPRNVSGPLPIFFQRLSEGKKCFVTKARRDFVYVGDLARCTVRAADGAGRGAYHFSSGGDVPILELYDAVVDGLQLNEYPEPEVRKLGPDDAPAILLDPSRLVADFGDIDFTSLKETVRRAVEYYRAFGVRGRLHASQTRLVPPGHRASRHIPRTLPMTDPAFAGKSIIVVS